VLRKGSGKKDIVVDLHDGNAVAVILGNGDGTFQPPVNYLLNAGNPVPCSVLLADLKGDGNLDIITTNSNTATMSIFINKGDGTGTFNAPYTINTGSEPGDVIAADFNGDGKIDLATEDTSSNTVSIYIGNGDGTFKPRVTYPVGNKPSGILAFDFNGDGIMDLAVANSSSNTISMLFGNGDGTFQNQIVTPMPAGVGNGMGAADFNGDGVPDIAMANAAYNSIVTLFFQNRGSGGGGSASPGFSESIGSWSVAVTYKGLSTATIDDALASMGP